MASTPAQLKGTAPAKPTSAEDIEEKLRAAEERRLVRGIYCFKERSSQYNLLWLN